MSSLYTTCAIFHVHGSSQYVVKSVADPEIAKRGSICVLRFDFENSLIFIDYVINSDVTADIYVRTSILKKKNNQSTLVAH